MDVVLATSQATRQAVLETLPEISPDRIHVTVPGIGEEFESATAHLFRRSIARLTLHNPTSCLWDQSGRTRISRH